MQRLFGAGVVWHYDGIGLGWTGGIWVSWGARGRLEKKIPRLLWLLWLIYGCIVQTDDMN